MKGLCLVICVCGLILSGVGTATANSCSWQVVYQTDFASDAGWITNAPDKMYWDQQEAKYHFQLTGSGEYTFVPIAYCSVLSYKFEFDIELVCLDYASGISFGLGDPDMREGEPVQWLVNYARGDRGNGATLGYYGDSSSGYFPPPYAFLYKVNTVYHNVIVYDATAQKLMWQVTRISDGIVVADYSSPTGIGTFTGIDRICAKISPGANTSEGYIDNLVLYSSAPVENDPPIADGGDDIIASANEEVILDATNSSDPDGEIILYTWQRLPDGVVIYSGEEPTCQTRSVGRAEEVIELTVTDNYCATATDTVRIINRTTQDLQDHVAAMQSQIEELQQQIQELQALVDQIASWRPITEWLERLIE